MDTVIDLDRVRDDRAARTRWGGWVTTAWSRPLKAALVVAASLLTAGASAPAAGPRMVAVLGERPAAAIALGERAAFVAADETPGVSSIRRYDVGEEVTGAAVARWSADLSEEVIALRYIATAEVVVAELDPTRSSHGTVVLDAATGRVLWRAAETDVVELPGTSALLIGRGGDGQPVRLRSVALRTGTERWRHAVRPKETLLLDPEPATGHATRTIVLVDLNGTAAVVAPGDGAIVASRSLAVRPNPSDRDYQREFTEVTAIGDRLYVTRRDQAATTIGAFRLDTLEPTWHSLGGPVGRLTDCGELICVSDDRTVSTLTPQTATVRWTTDRWVFLVPFGTGRLLAYDTRQEMSVVDAATGTRVAQLGAGVMLAGSPPTFLRQDTTDHRLVWVVQADESGARLRTVGRVRDIDAYGCIRRDQHLACRGGDGIARVWRLP